jgi:hypothetical protein
MPDAQDLQSHVVPGYQDRGERIIVLSLTLSLYNFIRTYAVEGNFEQEPHGSQLGKSYSSAQLLFIIIRERKGQSPSSPPVTKASCFAKVVGHMTEFCPFRSPSNPSLLSALCLATLYDISVFLASRLSVPHEHEGTGIFINNLQGHLFAKELQDVVLVPV